MKKQYWRILAIVFGILFIILTCGGTAYSSYLYGARQVEEITCPECQGCTPCPECPTVESAPAIITEDTSTDTETQDNCLGWQGDNFGQEMPLPDTIQGPAIAELWDQNTSFCALVMVEEGESLDWSGSGAYWQADDSCALEDRWPHHRQEYLFNQDSCQIITNLSLVPTE